MIVPKNKDLRTWYLRIKTKAAAAVFLMTMWANVSRTVTRWRQHVEEVKWTRGLRLSTRLHRVAIGKYKIIVVIVMIFIVKLLHLGCNMYC